MKYRIDEIEWILWLREYYEWENIMNERNINNAIVNERNIINEWILWMSEILLYYEWEKYLMNEYYE